MSPPDGIYRHGYLTALKLLFWFGNIVVIVSEDQDYFFNSNMLDCPLWNQATLTPPPNVTLRVDLKQWNQLSGKTRKFKKQLEANLIDVSVLETLKTEGAFLSRWLYKLQLVFRQDKARMVTSKVYKALKKFVPLSIWKDMRDFNAHIGQILGSDTGLDVYLPVQQQLQWHLVRIQGAAQLACTIAVACQESGYHMLNKIYTGHFVTQSMLCLANLSRIWSRSQAMLLNLINLYDAMKQNLPSFPAAESTWLPPNYELPENLEHWLCSQPQNASLLSLLRANLSVGGTKDLFWRKLGLKKAIEISKPSKIQMIQSAPNIIVEDQVHQLASKAEGIDVGEPLAREDLVVQEDKKSKKRKKPNRKIPLNDSKLIKLDESEQQDCLESLFSPLINAEQDLGESVPRVSQSTSASKKKKNRKKSRQNAAKLLKNS